MSVTQTLDISQQSICSLACSLAPNRSAQRTYFQYTFNSSTCLWLNFYYGQICNTLFAVVTDNNQDSAVAVWSHYISAREPAAESSTVNLLVLFHVNTTQASQTYHKEAVVNVLCSALFRK